MIFAIPIFALLVLSLILADKTLIGWRRYVSIASIILIPSAIWWLLLGGVPKSPPASYEGMPDIFRFFAPLFVVGGLVGVFAAVIFPEWPKSRTEHLYRWIPVTAACAAFLYAVAFLNGPFMQFDLFFAFGGMLAGWSFVSAAYPSSQRSLIAGAVVALTFCLAVADTALSAIQANIMLERVAIYSDIGKALKALEAKYPAIDPAAAEAIVAPYRCRILGNGNHRAQIASWRDVLRGESFSDGCPPYPAKPAPPQAD